MKKLIIIVGLVLVILFGALLTAPYLFRDRIQRMVGEEIRSNLNADVSFGKLRLSFMDHFPNLTVKLQHLVVVNRAPFAGDTLTVVPNFGLEIDLFSLFGGNSIRFTSLEIDRPYLHLIKRAPEVVNWNITRAQKKAAEPSAGASFALSVQKYEIRGAAIIYEDAPANQFIELRRFNHSGSGNLSQTVTELSTRTDFVVRKIRIGKSSYLSGTKLNLTADFLLDMAKKSITLRQNRLALDKMTLKLDGSINFGGKYPQAALSFSAEKPDLRNLMSLLPGKNAAALKNTEIKGALALKGSVRGPLGAPSLPALDIRLTVRDGYLKNPAAGQAIRDITMDFRLTNPGGNANGTVIDLEKLHLVSGSQKFDARLRITSPLNNPRIRLTAAGYLDLAGLSAFLPARANSEMKGRLQADLNFTGRISSKNREVLPGANGSGQISLADFSYRSDQLPAAIAIPVGKLTFAPQRASLERLEIKIGKSDIALRGKLLNLLPYLLTGQNLQGDLRLNSRYLDINPFMAGSRGKMEATPLPEGIKFRFTCWIKRLHYENLNLDDFRGEVLLEHRTLTLKDLKANLLGGRLAANGSYSTLPGQKPRLAFNLNVNEIGIAPLSESFAVVRKFVPMAQYVEGKLNGKFKLNSDLKPDMEPVWEKFLSSGEINVSRSKISNFPPLNQMASLLKQNQLKNPTVDAFRSTYQIKGGRFHLNPTNLKVGNLLMNVSGDNGLDHSLNYLARISIPAQKINREVSSFLSGIVKKKVNLLSGGALKINALIGGTIEKPKIKLSFKGQAKEAASPVATGLQKKADSGKKSLKEKAQADLKKKKKKAEEALKKKLKSLFKK